MTTEILATRSTLEAFARPDLEVMARPKRLRFTAEYRMSIVREADNCTRKGKLGALLRREGLYSSYLTQWRQQRNRGGLNVEKRVRKPTSQHSWGSPSRVQSRRPRRDRCLRG